MRYKLRSSKQPPRCTEPRGGSDCPPAPPALGAASNLRRRRTLVKNNEAAGVPELTGEKLTIFSLPQEVVLMVVELLDMESALAFLRCCQWFNSMLSPCDSFWKMLCIKTEFANYSCLETQPASRQLGWAGLELHNTGVRDRTCAGQWRRTWQRGIKMRRNVVAGNFQGWRLFSNSECPVAELSPTLDMNKVKQDLGEFPKLSVNDDLKIDWDDKVNAIL